MKLVQHAYDHGLSLTAYLRKELAQLAERPTESDIFKKLRALEPAKAGPTAASLIREDRESR
jgi:hypothetical protein